MGEMREILRGNIEKYIIASGLSQKEIADSLGISKSSVTNWVRGKNSPDVDLLPPLCRLLRITAADLYSDGSKSERPPSVSEEAMKLARDYDVLDSRGKNLLRGIADMELAYKRRTMMSSGVIDIFPTRHFIQSASAGYGDFSDDGSYETIDLIKRPPAGMSFLITVNGDSMEPTFRDGDLLFVRAQETIHVGEIGLFSINGNLFIKERGADGLRSHNGRYPLITPTESDTFRVEGKILGVCTPDYLQ